MAYADESPLVGSNYVRAAVVNLAMSEAMPLYTGGLPAWRSRGYGPALRRAEEQLVPAPPSRRTVRIAALRMS